MMSYLTSPYKILKRIFSWPRGTHDDQPHGATTTTANGTMQSNTDQKQYPHEVPKKDSVHSGQRDAVGGESTTIPKSGKRKATDTIEMSVRKKGKVTQDIDGQLCSAHALSEVNGNYDTEHASTKNKKSDRELMPPPALPTNRQVSTSTHTHRTTTSLESVDAFSDAQTSITESSTDPDMERIRRQSAVIGLPPNTGIWEPDERELWTHINNRGREALLPRNWMIDFPTLPLNLFATRKDQVPLIECHKSSEFRSIKALQELIETGKTLRDRTFSPNAQYRRETTIEKAMNKYIRWGLNDVSITSKQHIPVHAIVARKKGQTSRDVIRELTLKMHKLSSRHREESGVLTTIEREPVNDEQDGHNETRLSDDVIDAEHNLPTIYGLAVTSSVLTVFTLNSHTLPPPYITRALSMVAQPEDKDEDEDKDEEDEEEDDDDDDNDDESAGLKLIEGFDFSESTHDVWNAFVVAIVTMMIRKTLTEIYDFEAAPDEEDVDESVLENSVIDGDIGKHDQRHRSRGVQNVEEDPDL